MLIQLLLLTLAGAAFAHPLFYMYELDESFWWRWPLRHSDCSGNGYVGHEHAELSGIGEYLVTKDWMSAHSSVRKTHQPNTGVISNLAL